MNHRLFFQVALATGIVACFASSAAAQAPAPPSVAIIDMTYIFEKHPGFQARRDQLRGLVEQAENDVKGRQEELKKLVDRLNEYNPGTPEYKQLEEEITKRDADLKVKVQLSKKEFLLQEAKMYYTVYQEIADETRMYAERAGIQLVLRFNGDQIDTNNPQEVLKELNKAVVYSNPSIDITPIVLQQIERRQGQPAATTGARPVQQVPGAPGAPPRRQ